MGLSRINLKAHNNLGRWDYTGLNRSCRSWLVRLAEFSTYGSGSGSYVVHKKSNRTVERKRSVGVPPALSDTIFPSRLHIDWILSSNDHGGEDSGPELGAPAALEVPYTFLFVPSSFPFYELWELPQKLGEIIHIRYCRGFKEVREEEKSQMVSDVFSSVASNYDLMNDFMSVGLHRLWKDRLVSKLNPFPGMKHLDVAGGTGDVAFRIMDSINSTKRRVLEDAQEDVLHEETQIYVCDINPNMLNVGRKRAIGRGLAENKSLIWVEGDAESLNFDDNSMDGYTIAFGIRNVTHIEKVLSEAYRVLRRGGRFLCLELSHVDIPIFKELYDYYSFSVIPAMGELVAGDRQSYQYLVESIRRFPPQEKFASMIAGAGFKKVEYENLVGGVVAIHSGLKI
ncbi:hypothetical protein SAY87_018760 [Trapa incisa]|uniref:2-methoxy-6-polyprenyl-1,4-benzoquinol methylase, mitochondrial n=1 Tax=Trapa incisa TaxID=236973 RepID=A0AAN7Q1L8_9MYRT|nr:hypothetical protein SAY87_018760 [Trapa incisa]